MNDLCLRRTRTGQQSDSCQTLRSAPPLDLRSMALEPSDSALSFQGRHACRRRTDHHARRQSDDPGHHRPSARKHQHSCRHEPWRTRTGHAHVSTGGGQYVRRHTERASARQRSRGRSLPASDAEPRCVRGFCPFPPALLLYLLREPAASCFSADPPVLQQASTFLVFACLSLPFTAMTGMMNAFFPEPAPHHSVMQDRRRDMLGRGHTALPDARTGDSFRRSRRVCGRNNGTNCRLSLYAPHLPRKKMA